MIWDVHPRSWILNPDPDLFASLDLRSRSQIQGSKKHWIPHPNRVNYFSDFCLSLINGASTSADCYKTEKLVLKIFYNDLVVADPMKNNMPQLFHLLQGGVEVAVVHQHLYTVLQDHKCPHNIS
jgi:hypothetical protein